MLLGYSPSGEWISMQLYCVSSRDLVISGKRPHYPEKSRCCYTIPYQSLTCLNDPEVGHHTHILVFQFMAMHEV